LLEGAARAAGFLESGSGGVRQKPFHLHMITSVVLCYHDDTDPDQPLQAEYQPPRKSAPGWVFPSLSCSGVLAAGVANGPIAPVDALRGDD